jgi:hypothetical protein
MSLAGAPTRCCARNRIPIVFAVSRGAGPGLLAAALCSLLISSAADASELFRFGEVEGVVNLSLGYGIIARVEDRDSNLIGVANGGSAKSVNSDDGNLNYDEGIVSNQVRATAEVALRWRNFGAFVRGYGFYDFETELGGGRRTELTDDGDWAVGGGAGLQDAYLTADFDVADVPIQLRVGNQVVNWGESNFLRFGIDVVNPVDLVALTQPTTTASDLYVRQGMIWGVANLSENVAVETFYQFDWNPVPLPPSGSFFSADDIIGVDESPAFAGFGAFSDQGTNLDAAFAPTNQPLGFDKNFMKIYPGDRDEPDDQGQFGFALQTFLPILNASKFSLYFANYHSRLPMMNGRTADSESVAQTTDAAVDAQALTYGITRSSSELLTVGDLANETRYRVTYPEDIKMLGFGFSTATAATGTLISAEVSHHFNWPLQIPKEEVLAASLSPVEFTSPLASALQNTSLGAFGADETVKGWFDVGRTQTSLGVTQLLGPRLGASRSVVAFDIAWVHIDDLPSTSVFDEDSWGYRLTAALTYDGIFGGIALTPLLRWTHDVDGVTPGPGGGFVEERKSITAALDIQYTQRWTASLSYVHDFGGIHINGASVNLLEDRDFVRFNVIFHY